MADQVGDWATPQQKLLDVVRHMTPDQRQELWDLLTEQAKIDCTCGWGGVHDPDNPRCERNQK